jgi:cytochrome P450
MYQGVIPTLVVSDPEFLQEVFVKQFSSCHGRRPNPIASRSRNVFSGWGAEWRRHRHIINPTFSATKLQMMSPLING